MKEHQPRPARLHRSLVSRPAHPSFHSFSVAAILTIATAGGCDDGISRAGNTADAGLGPGDGGGIGIGDGDGTDGGGTDGASAFGQPAGWDDEFRLPAVADLNPDPNILEFDLATAVSDLSVLPETTTPVWTYNGQLPGPLIRAKAGDRVIAHFTNRLPETSMVHWHGVRLNNAMDGTPATQAPVPTDGTFEYDFTVPDAALFWYHPHVDSTLQVGNGLYGALLVDDPNDHRDFGDEVVIVLSDISVYDNGTFIDPSAGGVLIKIFGAEGTVLVNGKRTPTLRARAGRRQRWRIVNAARSRYFYLSLAGHRFVRIGGDGGLREAPIESDYVMIPPAERGDVLVIPTGEVGTRLAVQTLPYDRGSHLDFGRLPEDIFYVEIAAEAAGPAPTPLPQTLRSIEPLDLSQAKPHQMIVDLNATGYRINGVDTGDVVFNASVGDTHLWTIDNQSEFDHPFHMHGYFFQVIDEATGLPTTPREWKDTYNIHQHQVAHLAVRYDARPGMWMFHCHILDHADVGLMAMLHVGP